MQTVEFEPRTFKLRTTNDFQRCFFAYIQGIERILFSDLMFIYVL